MHFLLQKSLTQPSDCVATNLLSYCFCIVLWMFRTVFMVLNSEFTNQYVNKVLFS